MNKNVLICLSKHIYSLKRLYFAFLSHYGIRDEDEKPYQRRILNKCNFNTSKFNPKSALTGILKFWSVKKS